jgi:hypothetical protein
MSDKDYFGDDWVDDAPLGESQIEYPEDLLDESFGVEEVESEDVDESSSDSPQRPKFGVLGSVRAEEYLTENDAPEAGVPVPNFATTFDSPDSGDMYFEDEKSVGGVEEKSAGNPVPIVSNIPNAHIAPQGESKPKRPNVTDTPTVEVVPTTQLEESPGVSKTSEIDLIDIVTSGVDETLLVSPDGIRTVDGEVDIDYDPDEGDSDSEEDYPLDVVTSTAEVADDEEYFVEEESDSETAEEDLVAGTAKTKKTPTRKRKTGPKKRRGPKPGIRLTARDMQILTFLARYRVATVAQLARMFETSETALRNRLPRLEKEKMVSWAWGAQSKPKLWLITRQGLQVVNMTLTVPTVKWGQLRHTLGLTDLGIEFELAGEVVITEREIRAAATRYTPTARIKTAVDFMHYVKSYEEEDESEQIQRSLTVPMTTRSFGHIPDMVLARQSYPNGASGNIAIELELNRKHTNEWVAVLTAYRDTDQFESVQYYTMNKEIKRALTAIVKALGAEDKIQIHYFVPIDNTADPLVTGGK